MGNFYFKACRKVPSVENLLKGFSMMRTKYYLYRRNNGIYYIGKKVEGKIQWKSTGESLVSQARKILQDADELFVEKNTRITTLSEFINEFYPYIKVNLAPTTFSVYKRAFEQFQKRFGNILLTSITARHFDQFKTSRVSEIKPMSVNQELRTLKAALNVAVRWDLIAKNPFVGQKMLFAPGKMPSFFTAVEIQKVVAIMPEPILKEIIMFTAMTGLRRGEVVNLRWCDVDMDRQTIRIQTSANFKTKQGKFRILPLHSVAFYIISRRMEEEKSEYVFTRIGRPLTGDWVSKELKHYINKAGLSDKDLHFHSLRHSFASWLVQSGVSLYEVQKLLGHSNIAVTQIYSHLQTEYLHTSVNKIQISLN